MSNILYEIFVLKHFNYTTSILGIFAHSEVPFHLDEDFDKFLNFFQGISGRVNELGKALDKQKVINRKLEAENKVKVLLLH